MKCREPRAAAGDKADYEPINDSCGNLIAICSTCTTAMYRRISLTKLDEVRGNLDITFPQASSHINERDDPSVSSDFEQGG